MPSTFPWRKGIEHRAPFCDLSLMDIRSLLIPVLLISLCLAGCGIGGGMESVTIKSDPPGALLSVNGEDVGRAPASVNLNKKVPHEVTATLDGYKSETRFITPVPNERADSYVKFGLAEDAGMYVTLAPNPLIVELQSGYTPSGAPAGGGGANANAVPGAPAVSSAYTEFRQRVSQLNRQLESGEITRDEYDSILVDVIEHYDR